jgi:hypothetical protein
MRSRRRCMGLGGSHISVGGYVRHQDQSHLLSAQVPQDVRCVLLFAQTTRTANENYNCDKGSFHTLYLLECCI